MGGTDEPTDLTTIETPRDSRLPPVPGERYGSLDVADGTTLLFDREEESAWLRADCAVVPGR
jgi:hypothetical protein